MKLMQGDSPRRMQKVRFRSVDEFLDYLPAEERVITEILREIILDSIPGVKERLSYNVPFYKSRAGICFIWPSSVLWGSRKTYEGVRLGFIQGHLLRDELGYLDMGTRKQVAYHDYLKEADIDLDLLKTFIFDAVRVDSLI
jgi:hypothetical protein